MTYVYFCVALTKGKLTIVPTPIGNMGDITYRAVEVLRSADLILAEDTRQTAKLLQHYGIAGSMQSYHNHNEHKLLQRLAEQLDAGALIALCSDAGTPGISDPGFLLVRECIAMGIDVECLPGATALIPALVSSGLPCDRFVFEGFLPHKKGKQSRIQALLEEERTTVFYESPHRILKTLTMMEQILGPNRPVVVARELSKHFEEVVRGSVEEVRKHFESGTVKGEFVLVVGGVE